MPKLKALLALVLMALPAYCQLGNASRLQGHQVSPTAPSNGQALCWDAASGSWKPATSCLNAGVAGPTGPTGPAGTNGTNGATGAQGSPGPAPSGTGPVITVSGTASRLDSTSQPDGTYGISVVGGVPVGLSAASSGGGGGGASWITGTFSNTSSFNITHNLNTLSPHLTIWGSNGCLLGSTTGCVAAANVISMQATDANTVAVTLSAAISGTWSGIGPPSPTPTSSTPTDSPGTGTYSSTQSVTLTSGTPAAAICYRLDGIDPTAPTAGTCGAGSTTYSGAISIASTTTITALATKIAFTNSSVLNSVYTISSTVATPTDTPGQGTYSSTQSVALASASSGATVCYTVDGSTPTAVTAGTCSVGTVYTTPISVSATTTIKALGTKAGLTNSGVLTSVYTLGAATPAASPGAGGYIGTQTVTLTSTTSGATICYTTDGSSPAAASPGTCSAGTTYSTGISIAATTTLKALATKAGLSNSSVLSSTYTIQAVAPVDSPGAGTYGSTQSVTLTSSTGSAVICYTTNGTTPAATTPGTCSTGTTYSGAISISSTTTLKAIATKSGLTNSSVLTAVYTIAITHTYTVQTATAAAVTGSGGTTTCTFSPASQAGDLIVTYQQNSHFGNTLSVTDNAGGGSSTYSTAVNDTTNSSYNSVKVQYAWGVASGITTVTLAFTPTFSIDAGGCFLVHDSGGAWAADPLDQTPHQPNVLFTSSGTPFTITSQTPVQTDGLVFSFVGDSGDNATSWTATGGSWVVGSNVTAGFPYLTQYLLNTTATAYGPSVTAASGGGNLQYQGAVVIFRHQ